MGFLRAVALVALVAATASAQATSCSSYWTGGDCLSNSCSWCSTTYSGDSGTCVASTTACSTTSYSVQVTNPCPALTTSASCQANPVCGWCSTGSCMWAGFSYSESTPSGCSATFTQNRCPSFTNQVDCYNAPWTCEWSASGSCSYIGGTEYNDCTWTTLTACTGTQFMYTYNTGTCGFCNNYYGTGQTRCLYYTGSVPTACPSSSAFTYNTNWNGNGAAVAAAVGLVGAVLIIVIVAPLVVCACIIGCSVYWCCIRQNQNTTVVVAGGQPVAYAQMPQQQQPMNAYAQPGAYPPPKQAA